MGKRSKKSIAVELNTSSAQTIHSTKERLDSQKKRLLLKRIYDKAKQPLLPTISDITDIFVREFSLQSDESSNNFSDTQLKINIDSRLFELDRLFLEYKNVVAEIQLYKQKAKEAMVAATDKQKLQELISQREVIGNLLVNNIYYLIDSDRKIELLLRLICDERPEKAYYLMVKFAEYLVSVENGVGFQADKLLKTFIILLHFFSDVQYDFSFMQNPKEKSERMKELLNFTLLYGSIENKQQRTLQSLEKELRQPAYVRQGNDIYIFYNRVKNIANDSSVHTLNEQFGIKLRPYLSMGLISVQESERLSHALIKLIHNLLPHAEHKSELFQLFNLLIFCENILVDCFLHTQPLENLSELFAKPIYIRCYQLELDIFEKSPELKQANAMHARTSQTSIQFAQISEMMKHQKRDFPQDTFLTIYLTGLGFSTIHDLHYLKDLEELQALARLEELQRGTGVQEIQEIEGGQEIQELKKIEGDNQKLEKLKKLDHLKRHLKDCENSVEYFANTQIVLELPPVEKHRMIKALGQLRQRIETLVLSHLTLQELNLILNEMLPAFSSLAHQSTASPTLCVGGILYFRLLELTYGCEMLTCHIAKKLANDIDLIITQMVGKETIDIRQLKEDMAFFFGEILSKLEQLFRIIVLPLPEFIHVEEFRALTVDAINLDTLEKKPGKIAKEALSREKVLFYQQIFLRRRGFLDEKNIEQDTKNLVAVKYLLELPSIGRLAALCEQLEIFDLHRRRSAVARTVAPNLPAPTQSSSVSTENMPNPSSHAAASDEEKNTSCTAENSQTDNSKSKSETTASKHIAPTLRSQGQIVTLGDAEFIPVKKSKNARRRQKEKEKKERKTHDQTRKIPLQSLSDYLSHTTAASSQPQPTASTVFSPSHPPNIASTKEFPSLILQSKANQNRADGEPICIKELKLNKKIATFYQSLQKILQDYYPDSKLVIIGTAAFELTSNQLTHDPSKFCDINFGLAIKQGQKVSNPGLTFKEIANVQVIYLPHLQYEKHRATIGMNFSIIILPPPTTACLISGLQNDFAHCGIYIELETQELATKYVAYAIDQNALNTLRTKELVLNYPAETLVKKHPPSLFRAGHFLYKHNMHWPLGDEGAIKLSIKDLTIEDYEKNYNWLLVFKKLQIEITRMGLPFCQFLLSYGLWGVLCANNPKLGIELTITPDDIADITLIKSHFGENAGIFTFFVLRSWCLFKTISEQPSLLEHDIPIFLKKALEIAEMKNDKKSTAYLTEITKATQLFWFFPRKNIALSEQQQKELLETIFGPSPK